MRVDVLDRKWVWDDVDQLWVLPPGVRSFQFWCFDEYDADIERERRKKKRKEKEARRLAKRKDSRHAYHLRTQAPH